MFRILIGTTKPNQKSDRQQNRPRTKTCPLHEKEARTSVLEGLLVRKSRSLSLFINKDVIHRLPFQGFQVPSSQHIPTKRPNRTCGVGCSVALEGSSRALVGSDPSSCHEGGRLWGSSVDGASQQNQLHMFRDVQQHVRPSSHPYIKVPLQVADDPHYMPLQLDMS